MKKKNILKLVCLLSLLGFFVFSIRTVYAQVPSNYTSSSYILSDPIFGESGPYSQSTNFKEKNALGQLVTGVSQSANFIIKSGFEYYSGQSVPSITMTINTNIINFNNILPGIIYKSSTNTIVTISSNSENGYNLYANQNSNLNNSAGDQITPVTNGATTTVAEPFISSSNTGLGYNCSTSNSYISSVLANSPQGFWPLSETSRTTAYDLSGNNNNGTYTGGYTQGESGPISNHNLGNSTLFNGSTGYVAGGNLGTYFGANNPLTVIAWVFVSKSTNGPIFGVSETTSPATINSWDTPFLSIDGTTIFAGVWENSVWMSYTVSPGWHQLALTYTPTGTGEEILYIDGTQVNSGTGEYSPSGGNDYFANVTNAGSSRPSGVNQYFTGKMSDVIAFDSQLSSTQIQTMFNDAINSNQSFCNPDFINSTYYRQFSDTPTEFASYSSIANNQVITINYAVSIGSSQASGNYTNTITYTVSGDY